VEVRVHLYQRSFPEEPDRRVRTRREWMADTAPDKGCALSDRKDRARFGRTNVKCIRGVSDPRGPGAGRRRGQPIGGRSRPPVALLGCDSGADSRPAAQSAAVCRREAAAWQEDSVSVIVLRAMRPLDSANSPGVGRGTVLPSFGSPTLFPSEVSRQPATREGETGR
jgi:hypothetical protein